MPQVYDAHELLGVRVDASAEEIKKAFRQRAKDVHPDLSQAPDATEQFQRLNAAHQLLLERLSNPRAPVPPILHRETKPVSESKRSSRRSNVHHNTPEQAERKRQEREAERARAEQESLARKRAEQERLERLQRMREEIERHRAEQERLAREQAEREQAERKREERERQAQREAEQAQRAEQERLERLQRMREEIERRRAEQEHLAREEAERQRQEAERERKREAAERKRIRAEQERAPPRRANGWRAERSEPPSSRAPRRHGVKEESRAITNRDHIGRALDLLKDCLAPYVEREFTNEHRESADEEARGYFRTDRHQPDGPIQEWDVAALLNVMIWSWNDIFRQSLGRNERNWTGELLEVRNGWAHQKSFSSDDTERALDTAARLLSSISASEAADEITKMRSQLLRTMLDQQTQNEQSGNERERTEREEVERRLQEEVRQQREEAERERARAEQERVAREEVERRLQEEVRQQREEAERERARAEQERVAREAQRPQGAREVRERTQRQPSARRTPARVPTPQRQAKPPSAQRTCAWKDCSEFRNLSEPFTTELGPRRFCTTHRADYIKRNAKKSVRRN